MPTLTPTRAMRLKCIDCSGDSAKEVRLCQVFVCPLWQWRFGKRPATIHKLKPWLMDPEAMGWLAKAEDFREKFHETKDESYAKRFGEIVALAIAKYPTFADERCAHIGRQDDLPQSSLTNT